MQAIVVSIPHPTLGTEPFAVIDTYNGRTEDEVRDWILITLGNHYALGGLASLNEVGLKEFPVNQTHKILKSELQRLVIDYIRADRHTN
jgi:acyl-CoA synthetase (AMP-forming)/AMP-acid ligase II